jgi:hypothetical protein
MKQNVSRHEDDGVYDTTTCFEFHRFLIATLLAYGKALGGLKKAYEKDVKDMNDLVQKCHHVWLCCQLLSKIASSRMICQHLIACQELLSLPSSNKRKAYNDYTKFPMADAEPSANAEDLDSAVEGIDVEGDETLDQMFLKWVRLQASYWLDLSLLSRTFGSSGLAQAVPEVFLIAVKHPNPQFQFNAKALPLEPLRDTLNDIVGHSSKHPIDINIVLATIKKMETVVNMYEGTVHCEIALAALILEAQKLSAADIKRLGFLADLLQVMFTCIIVIINLTRCAERGPKYHCSIKAMLPDLLGALGRLQRPDQPIHGPWPPSYPFPGGIASMAFSAGNARNGYSLRTDPIR